MHQDILKLQVGIRDIFLSAMIYQKNKFEKKDYFILSQLLWGIDNYPSFGIPYKRFGIWVDENSSYYEMVIRFEKEFLWLGKEGAERTAMGSDSFEKEYLHLAHNEAFQKNQLNETINLGELEEWYAESNELIETEKVRYTIEY